MKCLSYSRKKHKDKFIDFPCGNCEPCKINKKNGWINRAYVETKYCKTATFLTFQVYDQYLEYQKILDQQTGAYETIQAINKSTLQKVIRAMRQKDIENHKKYPLSWNQKTNPQKVLGLGEFGEKLGRQHYHLLAWNFHPKTIEWESLQKLWSKGYVDIGKIQSGSIAYVVSHQLMDHKEGMHPEQKPFSLKSNNIGMQYIEIHKASHKEGRKWFLTEKKSKAPIPEGYKRKYKPQPTNKDKLLKSFLETEDFEQFNEQNIFKSNSEALKRKQLIERDKQEAEHMEKHGCDINTGNLKRIAVLKYRKKWLDQGKKRL